MKNLSTKALSVLMAVSITGNVGLNTFAQGPDKIPVNSTTTSAQSMPSAPSPLNNISSAITKWVNFQALLSMIMQQYPMIKNAKCYIERKMHQMISKKYAFYPNNALLRVKLEDIFSKQIHGQQNIQDNLQGFIFNFLDYISEKDRNPHIRPRGHILYLIGASGVGKSKCADAIANAMLQSPSSKLTVDSASIDPNDGRSLSYQLFSLPESIMYSTGYVESPSRPDNIASHIYVRPRSVVIINEYDKFFDQHLDETLRSIVDNGCLYSYNDSVKIPCDETLFIITSNEKKTDFPSLFPECSKPSQPSSNVASATESEDPETPEPASDVASTAAQENPDAPEPASTVENPTKTKKHEQTFTNRLTVIPFEQLHVDSLSKITKDFLEEKAHHFKEEYNINVTFDDEVISQIASFVESSPQGARAITNKLDQPLILAINRACKDGKHGTLALKFLTNGDKVSFDLEPNYTKNEIDDLINNTEEFLRGYSQRDICSAAILGEELDPEMKAYLTKDERRELREHLEELREMHSNEVRGPEMNEHILRIQKLLSLANDKHLLKQAHEASQRSWFGSFLDFTAGA